MAEAPRQFDVGSIFGIDDLEIKVERKAESADERAARLVREERENVFAQWKGAVLFASVIVGIFGSMVFCGYLIVEDDAASPEVKHWALTLFASLITGVASFIGGKALGNK